MITPSELHCDAHWEFDARKFWDFSKSETENGLSDSWFAKRNTSTSLPTTLFTQNEARKIECTKTQPILNNLSADLPNVANAQTTWKSIPSQLPISAKKNQQQVVSSCKRDVYNILSYTQTISSASKVHSKHTLDDPGKHLRRNKGRPISTTLNPDERKKNMELTTERDINHSSSETFLQELDKEQYSTILYEQFVDLAESSEPKSDDQNDFSSQRNKDVLSSPRLSTRDKRHHVLEEATVMNTYDFNSLVERMDSAKRQLENTEKCINPKPQFTKAIGNTWWKHITDKPVLAKSLNPTWLLIKESEKTSNATWMPGGENESIHQYDMGISNRLRKNHFNKKRRLQSVTNILRNAEHDKFATNKKDSKLYQSPYLPVKPTVPKSPIFATDSRSRISKHS